MFEEFSERFSTRLNPSPPIFSRQADLFNARRIAPEEFVQQENGNLRVARNMLTGGNQFQLGQQWQR
jgi:hypothetical protein